MGNALVTLESTLVALRPRLMRYCHNLKSQFLPHVESWQAEDLYQETMLRVLKGRHLFLDDGKDEALMRWCSVVARNTTINIYRREQVHKNTLLPEELHHTPATRQDSSWETEQKLGVLCGLISARQSQMVNLRYRGYKYGEVAMLLAVPVGTVKSNLNRVKHKLRPCPKKS